MMVMRQKKDLPGGLVFWLRGLDLNQRPFGYEPNELPGCSTPRHTVKFLARLAHNEPSQRELPGCSTPRYNQYYIAREQFCQPLYYQLQFGFATGLKLYSQVTA